MAFSHEGEERRPGLSTAAASTVAARGDQVAFDWHDSCDASAQIDGIALVAVLVEGLRGCGGNTRRGHVHAGLHELFDQHPWLEHLEGADVTCLREIVRRQVLADLVPSDALAALHCISAVFDGLTEHLAAARLHRLEAVAFIDPLTGLGNRRAADEAIATQLATATRHGRPLTVVVADVDYLKVTNDTLGHDAGDAVLTRLADAFRSGLRQGDVAYRTGGDEFLLLLPETTLDDVDRVMDRVVLWSAPKFSYGAAEGPHEAASADALIRIADQRLLATRRAARQPGRRGGAQAKSRRRAGVRVAAAAAVLTAASVPAVLMMRQPGRVVSTSIHAPVSEQFPVAEQVETPRDQAEPAATAPVEAPVPFTPPTTSRTRTFRAADSASARPPSSSAPGASTTTGGQPTTTTAPPAPTTTTTRPPPTTTTTEPAPAPAGSQYDGDRTSEKEHESTTTTSSRPTTTQYEGGTTTVAGGDDDGDDAPERGKERGERGKERAEERGKGGDERGKEAAG